MSLLLRRRRVRLLDGCALVVDMLVRIGVLGVPSLAVLLSAWVSMRGMGDVASLDEWGVLLYHCGLYCIALSVSWPGSRVVFSQA